MVKFLVWGTVIIGAITAGAGAGAAFSIAVYIAQVFLSRGP